MTAMAALAVAPLRAPAAPAEDAARDGDVDNGGFAAALDLACDPAAGRVKTPSRADAKGPVAQATATDSARADDAMADTPLGGDAGTSTGPDLALLLPGWLAPAAPNAEGPAGATDIATAAAAMAMVVASAPASTSAPASAPASAPVTAAVVARGEASAVIAASAPVDSRSRSALGTPAAPARSPAVDARMATRLAASAAPASAAAPPVPGTPVTPATPVTRGEHLDTDSLLPAVVAAAPGMAPAAADRPQAPLRHGTSAVAVDPAPPAIAAKGDEAPATVATASSAAPTAGTQFPAHAAPAASMAVGLPFEAQIAAALDSAGFAPALASQVTWLVHEGQHHARLTLNPAEMGPVTVKIEVDGTHARVDFSAEMAATRSAIEASLPTLAAALNDSGLTLAGGGVFDGQARHGTPDERATRMPAPAAPRGTSLTVSDTAPALPLRVARGLVDLIA